MKKTNAAFELKKVKTGFTLLVNSSQLSLDDLTFLTDLMEFLKAQNLTLSYLPPHTPGSKLFKTDWRKDTTISATVHFLESITSSNIVTFTEDAVCYAQLLKSTES